MPKWAIAALAVGTLAATGCRKEATVPDVALARVPPAQMGPIEQQRAQVQVAEDQATKAKLELQQVENELSVAKADARATKARLEGANAAEKLARSRGDRQAITRAEKDISREEAALKAAELRTKYVDEKISLAKADHGLAEHKVDVQKAELEKQKYQALRAVNDPSVDKMSAHSFDSEVTKAQANVQKAEGKVAKRRSKTDAAQRDWQDQQRRVPAA